MRNLVKYFNELVDKRYEEESRDYDYVRDGDPFPFYKKLYGALATKEQTNIETFLTTIPNFLMQTTLEDLKNELRASLPKEKMDYPISDIKMILGKLDYQDFFKLYFKIHKFNKKEEKLKNRLLTIFHKYLNPQLAEKMVELAALQFRHYRYETEARTDPGSRTGYYFDYIVPYCNEIAGVIKVLAGNIKPNEVPRSNLANNWITFFPSKFHKGQQKSNENFKSAVDFHSEI